MPQDKTKEIIDLIPEVYYDLIARVTPGAIFLIGLSFLYSQNLVHLIKQTSLKTQLGFLIVFFLLSYFLGILFHSISRNFFYSFWRMAWKALKEEDKIRIEDMLSPIGCIISVEEDPLYYDYHMHSYIKAKDPSLGSVVAKMRGEAFLFSNLSIGLYILILIAIFYSFPKLTFAKNDLVLLGIFCYFILLGFLIFILADRTGARIACLLIGILIGSLIALSIYCTPLQQPTHLWPVAIFFLSFLSVLWASYDRIKAYVGRSSVYVLIIHNKNNGVARNKTGFDDR